MRKKLNGVMLATMLAASMSLTGCITVTVPDNNAKVETSASEEVATEVVKEEETEVVKEEETEVVKEEETEVVKEEETEVVKEEETEIAKEETAVVEKEQGLSQYKGFKADMPDDLVYYGHLDYGDGIDLALWTNNEDVEDAAIVLLTMYADFGKDQGFTINFSDMDEATKEDMAESMISYIGGDRETKYIEYNNLSYIMSAFESDGMYGAYAMTIEDNKVFVVVTADKDQNIEGSMELAEDVIKTVELNGEDIDEALDKELDEKTLEITGLGSVATGESEEEIEETTESKKEETKTVAEYDVDFKYGVNDFEFEIGKTTYGELLKVFPEDDQTNLYKYKDSITYTYGSSSHDANEFDVTFEGKGTDAVLVNFEITYSSYRDNKYVFPNLTDTSKLEDAVEIFGSDYEESDYTTGVYTWENINGCRVKVFTDDNTDCIWCIQVEEAWE